MTTDIAIDRWVAHRGYQRCYPENTLLAYRQAIAAGAVNIETDILLSADHKPVLYHDASLQRVSGRRGRVSDLRLTELCAIAAYEPGRLGDKFASTTITPLTDLVEFLAENPQVTAYVEIKKEAIAFAGISNTYHAVSDCLQAVAAQCCLISFHFEFVAYARAQGWAHCGCVLTNWHDLDDRALQDAQPDTLFCNYKKIPGKADLHRIPSELVLYEIANRKLAQKWLDRGAGKIETFDIGGMLGNGVTKLR